MSNQWIQFVQPMNGGDEDGKTDKYLRCRYCRYFINTRNPNYVYTYRITSPPKSGRKPKPVQETFCCKRCFREKGITHGKQHGDGCVRYWYTREDVFNEDTKERESKIKYHLIKTQYIT